MVDIAHFFRFYSDSAIRRGPALSGYHTAYPALDDNPTAVFWRDGVLQPGCEGGSRQVLQAEV
ncbi:hypothetical protein [Mycolicibacterium iranicum]|uniref:Uncharacterized protein n=1 Tax=Mycolicibacterium iranicum TaxID=912594 RepID=A0A178LRZ5_MYCIR|nr:hypothetical protein [Mycolicibacterium iranicum]OAN36750.1 hypothetical protein A4X20_06025 [Mycolicibacterium iranicum]